MLLKMSDPLLIIIMQQLRSHIDVGVLRASDITVDLTDIEVLAMSENKHVTVTFKRERIVGGNRVNTTWEDKCILHTYMEMGESGYVDKFEFYSAEVPVAIKDEIIEAVQPQVDDTLNVPVEPTIITD